MNQIQIGRFIAASRKARNLTQRQLADKLGISDKTVSKWECGKGLPEVSLMLPLCASLGITVNDLLSGERVSGTNYQKKAEENMMDLMKENEENKRRMILSVICAVITVIAVCALVTIASCLEMPAAVRVALLLFAAAVAATGVGAARRAGREGRVLPMPKLHAVFVPTMAQYVKGLHTLTRRRLTSPAAAKQPCAAPRCPVRAVLTFADVPPIMFFVQSMKKEGHTP